ncbi:unnamed protein product [Protopolystoma xenopodis]|uniref:Uncharacterized protein n=1 Tax=Protopolystoma xenopodis TaxID=117903 RepID=A0A3S4ZT92_9PLAT|nr:unnamed protein product [Protopolystoma xenopodis]
MVSVVPDTRTDYQTMAEKQERERNQIAANQLPELAMTLSEEQGTHTHQDSYRQFRADVREVQPHQHGHCEENSYLPTIMGRFTIARNHSNARLSGRNSCKNLRHSLGFKVWHTGNHHN